MRAHLFCLLACAATVAGSCSSSSSYDREIRPVKTLIRPSQEPPGIQDEFPGEIKRFHSAYHTENPYYDGRNMILDCNYQGAVDLLTKDIDALDYPNRAALWVFICKCKMGDKDGADKFIEQYVIDHKLDPGDNGVIASTIQYYLGVMPAWEIARRMVGWDDLDNCKAYYYYGAYQKYYENDPVAGYDYMARAMRTKMYEHSECKFAEKEIRGFTVRNTGNYKDFPVVESPYQEVGFLTPLGPDGRPVLDEYEQYIPSYSTGFNSISEIDRMRDFFATGDLDSLKKPKARDALDYMNDTTYVGEPGESVETSGLEGDEFYAPLLKKKDPRLDLLPKDVGDDQYVVPAEQGEGWEVLNQSDVLKAFREEAESIIDNLMDKSDYFYLEGMDGFQFYPRTNRFQTFSVAYREFLEKEDQFKEDFNIEINNVTLYLSEGDFVAGIKIPCRMYNEISNSFENQVFVSIVLLFTVNEDRTVDLAHRFSKVFQ